MTLTPDEARGALADIDQVSRKMRNTVAAGALAPNLMIWGVVWAIGFVLCSAWPERSQVIWWWLLPVGFGASLVVGVRRARERMVLSRSEKLLGLKMAVFWITIMAYATGNLFMWSPVDGRDIVVNFVGFAMMGYVIMGLWVGSGPLIVTGLVVTAATLVGRYAIPAEHFLIWMAVFGGGGLFIPGLYVHWRWK